MVSNLHLSLMYWTATLKMFCHVQSAIQNESDTEHNIIQEIRDTKQVDESLLIRVGAIAQKVYEYVELLIISRHTNGLLTWFTDTTVHRLSKRLYRF